MKLPVTAVSQNVTVWRNEPGHYDENSQWVEPGDVKIADIINATLIPISGNERASASLAGYDSNHRMFAGSDDISFSTGYSDFQAGDVVVDAKGKRYVITFSGDFKMVWTCDLKLEAPADGS